AEIILHIHDDDRGAVWIEFKWAGSSSDYDRAPPVSCFHFPEAASHPSRRQAYGSHHAGRARKR
ncbi:MAG: hypothetical protein ABI906_11220, partial [Pseudomonadota bacterium]